MKTNNVLVGLSVISDFPHLSVALIPKSIGFYWRCKSLKMAHKYTVIFFKKAH